MELSLGYSSGQPLQIRHIAQRHGIPSRFLVQILLQLKAAGIISSTRGAAGGYMLARSPEEITLDDVISAVEGGHEKKSSSGDSAYVRVLKDVWQKASRAEREILKAVTFADLIERARRKTANMYYI